MSADAYPPCAESGKQHQGPGWAMYCAQCLLNTVASARLKLPAVFGVSRVEDSDCVLLVAFRKPVSDDQLRALHELVRENAEAV